MEAEIADLPTWYLRSRKEKGIKAELRFLPCKIHYMSAYAVFDHLKGLTLVGIEVGT
jgi:hypothetical protein